MGKEAYSEYLEIIKLLVESGVDLEQTDLNGQSPMMIINKTS